jgi:hypothetical protein
VPLQKWMTEHGHPGWYSWLVVIGGCLVSMVVGSTISIAVNDRALERERAQREEARAATCLVIRQMENVYADPSTETGEKARAAWASLGRTFGCKE